MKQVVRIIGGLYRGKKLHFPEVDGLRPTPDRVRETVFNWLMHDIRDACCLDAFAGSGALGFEAFSRGAKQVVFLEQSPQAHANLSKIIANFNSPSLKLIQTNALNYLQNSAEQFDIIFLDPPFLQNYLQTCVEIIQHRTILKPGGLIYVESGSTLSMNETLWRQIKLKQSGQVMYGLFEKI